MDTQRELVTIMRAAALCKVSRRTVYNWLAAGKLETVRTPGGSIRIYLDTLFRNTGPLKRFVKRELLP